MASRHTGRRTRRAPLVLPVLLAAVLLTQTAHPAMAVRPGLASELDRWIAQRMETDDIPGAAVVVVADGEVVYRAGHGVEDLSTGAQVTPDRTRFHLGSISKALTATALVRLAEQGRVDLDLPVDHYLGEQTPPGEPPTLRQLLSHAGGYEQHAIGTGASDRSGFLPLVDYLDARPPVQVVSPGELTIYSSVGIAVAGRVLETVTGQPFPDAMHAELLRPAGMTATSFPTPPDDPATAIGHRSTSTGLHAYRDPYFSLVGPGGDVVSTADDITRFLLAHLDGSLLGHRASRDMHRITIRNHPAQRGRSVGFSEWGRRDSGGRFQDGGAPGTLSRLFLMPERSIGLFVAHTNGDADDFNRDLTDLIVDRLAPDADVGSHRPAGSAGDLSPYVGTYRDYSTSQHGLGRLAALLGQIQVTETDGALRIGARTYRPTADGVFTDDTGRVAAFRGTDRDVDHLLIDTAAYRRVPELASTSMQLGLLGGAVLISALAGAAGAIGTLRRTIALPVAVTTLVAGLGVVTYTAGVAVTLRPLIDDPWRAVAGEPAALQTLTIVLGASGAAAAAAVWQARRAPTPAPTILAAAVTIGTAGIATWAAIWGLL